MSLNESPSPTAPPKRSATVPLAYFVVGLIVVAGVAVAATAILYTPKTASPPGDITVTDDLGRTVSVPRDPAHVVVLGPNIMDSMYRLGLRSHVVGVDCYSVALGGLSDDYSPDQVSLWNLSQSMCVQVAPTFDFEALLNFTPELVLANTIVSVSAVETISSTYHIPVVMLAPATLSGIELDVSLIGTIFGVTTAANALNQQLSVELGVAAELDYNLSYSDSPLPTVLVTYDVDQNGYWTYGPATFGESLIELAGAENIAANATLPYPELPGEVVLSDNPDYIIYGTGFGLDLSFYQSAPFWSDLNATTNGHAIGVDSNDLTEADPTMILEGLPALIALFWPSGSG
jgi:ABC-type Fe3+-hydroxamate transport system substrate-binding protein